MAYVYKTPMINMPKHIPGRERAEGELSLAL